MQAHFLNVSTSHEDSFDSGPQPGLGLLLDRPSCRVGMDDANVFPENNFDIISRATTFFCLVNYGLEC